MSLDVYLTCPHCLHSVFSSNITHNLNRMADAAGIYQALWRPEEIGIKHAAQLIEPLRAGVAKLRAHPEQYRLLEPKNKWGTYEDFVPWIEEYLTACEENPECEVEVSR